MKKIFTLLSLFVFGSAATMAQTECDGARYRTYNLFPSVDVTSNVDYGSNTAVGSSNNTVLKLDVYAPEGDTETNRPVIVMAFGGSFIGGNKSDVASISTLFAKMGYVVIAPNYRVGFFGIPNQVSTTLAVVRAAHDIKAVVRFLRRSVAENSNPYGIDAERIIVGGISAGAIGAIHAAYLDDLDEFPAYMANDTAGLGGVEGNSGNLGFSSAPLAVLSFSGAIGDSTWITPGSVPICSIHEELDATVPYNTTLVSVSGFPTGLTASGSRDLHARAANVGIDNCLLTYAGVNNHVGYLAGTFDPIALDFASSFCADMVCGASSNCGNVFVGIEDDVQAASNALSIYPNPADEALFFTAATAGALNIVDIAGRVILTEAVQSGSQEINIASLSPGTYVIQVIGETSSAARFVKQ